MAKVQGRAIIGPPQSDAFGPLKAMKIMLSRDFKGVDSWPEGQSEIRSLGQAEAYPTKSPAFRM
jgi:hypothetical protein